MEEKTARVVYVGPYPEGQTVRCPNGLHTLIKPGEPSPELEHQVADAYVKTGLFEWADSPGVKAKKSEAKATKKGVRNDG